VTANDETDGMEKVKILSGEYEGYTGSLISDDGVIATVQLGGEEHDGDIVTVRSEDVESLASISKLFDDPEKAGDDD
jgi:hypothetical protein